jgi:viroplasmin and RNaseH domain-containing protein
MLSMDFPSSCFSGEFMDNISIRPRPLPSQSSQICHEQLYSSLGSLATDSRKITIITRHLPNDSWSCWWCRRTSTVTPRCAHKTAEVTSGHKVEETVCLLLINIWVYITRTTEFTAVWHTIFWERKQCFVEQRNQLSFSFTSEHAIQFSFRGRVVRIR